jgi:WD40 repeat protein
MQVLPGHTKDVRTVAYAPDGRLISGGGDKKVIIWEPSTPKILETIKAKCIVYAIAVSPDGKRLAFSGRPGDRVHLTDLTTNVAAGSLEWPPFITEARQYIPSITMQGSVWSLSFSADGEYLAGASRISGSGGDLDGFRARWWRGSPGFQDRGEFAELKVYAVGFATEGHAVAVTREGSVLLLDRPDGSELLNYKIQSTWAAAVAFVPFAKTLIIAASSYLHFVETDGSAKPQKVKSGFRSITSLSVSPDGRWLVVGGRPEQLELYDLASRTRKTVLDFGLGAIYTVAFAPDGCTFAVGGAKGLMVCDVP